MITLITGAPGTGKTAALVSMLEDLGQGRQLYTFGIPELAIPHQDLVDPQNWPQDVPDGAVVIIDEVQNVWRPRGPGQKVPDHIAALETHRHRGLDFYVITQGPNLVDSNVRALVGRHVHLRDLGVIGRWWYEWPECADNCRTAWKNAPLKKRYRLPKQIFDKYKSSSLHVKPVRSFPTMLIVMIVALIALVFLVWKSYQAIASKSAPVKAVATPQVQASQTTATSLSYNQRAQQAPPPDERVDFVPRLSSRPWTAPAYDGLRQVKTVPHITGAMCIDDKCTCTHAGRRLLDVSSDECRQWAKDRPFNPYASDVYAAGEKASANNQTPARPATEQVATDAPASAPAYGSI